MVAQNFWSSSKCRSQTVPVNEQQRHQRSRSQGGRLQRGPSAVGYSVATFGDVLKRHGVTMGCLAALSLMLPGSLHALAINTSRLFQQPMPYLAALLGILVFFAYWSMRRPVSAALQTRWILYLLFISIVEELTFRLILPSLLSPQFSWLTANMLSNLLFAGIHYFTLRWRLRNCIVTFLGGMGLSQLMTQGDFTMVVMIHWLGTFLNTPFPPAGRKV
jgi:membrane protease YdiL (CAAX protease family)